MREVISLALLAVPFLPVMGFVLATAATRKQL